MEESEEFVEDIQILESDKGVMNLPGKQESAPTKEKVAAFKSRVFHLLLLFVEKTKDMAPIMPLITEEVFMSDPNRMRELAIKIANRCLFPEDIHRFANLYKNLLLFKHHRENNKFGEDFVQILMKLRQHNEDAAKAIAQEMLDAFILKRKCRLNASFFTFLLKRTPWLKKTIIEKGQELQKRKGVRAAQQRVLEKLMRLLSKGNQVKKEHQEEQ
jgi:hypothetical protein